MMDSWPGYSTKPVALPRTLRYCNICQKETPHEVRTGAGVVARLCVECLNARLNFES
jgi:hypothetical protein